MKGQQQALIVRTGDPNLIRASVSAHVFTPGDAPVAID